MRSKEVRKKVLKRRAWLRSQRKLERAQKWFEKKAFALSNPTPSLKGNMVEDRNIPWKEIVKYSKYEKRYPSQWKQQSF